MIATALIAAGVLAPSGTATIQAYPVCVSGTVQPGHSYPLKVSVSGGSATLVVTPAHGSPENSLNQVDPSWVTFAANPAGPGTVPLTLNIPGDAAPGAYWSDIKATTGGQAQPGSGAQADLGTAGTAAFVFTVGPSKTAPPPCDALDLAYSTGKFPAWPTPKFATTSWDQVFARQRASEPRPLLSPTAGTGAGAVPAAYDPVVPASPAAAQWNAGSPKNVAGWVLLGLAVAYAISRIFRMSS